MKRMKANLILLPQLLPKMFKMWWDL